MSMGNAANNEISALLVQGFKAAKEGRRDEAYNIFCEVVRRDPNNELGWLYRAATTDDLSESYVCLQRVLSINPNNEKAQRGIERIKNRYNEEEGGDAAGAAAIGMGAIGVGDDVVSGFNNPPQVRVAGSGNVPSPPPTPEFNFNQGAEAFGNDQPFARPVARDLPDVPPTVPPPYSSQQPTAPFGNMQEGLDNAYQPNPNFYDQSPNQGYDPNYGVPGVAPQYADEYAQYNQPYGNENAMVDEPVSMGEATKERLRSGRGKQPTQSRRRVGGALAGAFAPLAAGRARGKAAFGSETPTALDNEGRRKVRQVQTILYGLGALLFFGALVLFAIYLLSPRDGIDQAAAEATATAQAAGLLVPTVPGNNPGVTVVGTTSAAVNPPPVTTVVPPVQTSAPVPPQTTQVAPPANTTSAPNPPANTTAAPAPPPANPSGQVQPRPAVYTVQAGNSVYGIATQYNTTMAALKAANPEIPANNLIFRGQRFVVPVNRPNYAGRGSAILKDGETLQAVAQRIGVDVNQLAAFNGYANPADAKPGDGILFP
jgi:LysM repeat protein